MTAKERHAKSLYLIVRRGEDDGPADEVKQGVDPADETGALADELGLEKGNKDSLAALERALKPIERFAVKWVEQVIRASIRLISIGRSHYVHS